MKTRTWNILLVLLSLLLPTTHSQEFPILNSLDQSNSVTSNHAPVLQVSSREGYLPETAEIGTTVRISPNLKSESLQILVNDDDLQPGMPPATYQYILTGLGATIFAVDQRGFVYLNVPNIDADPPNPSTYQLNVQAREVDTVPIRSSEPVSITIHIMDSNDNSPQFEQAIYTANTTAIGGERPIVMIVATDADSGAYGEISYRITQVTNGAQDAFYYESATNMLFATSNLVPGERYQVVLEATDGGGRSSQAIAIILAVDPNHKASLAPNLPGMETFMPHPSQSTMTTPMAINSLEQEETIQTYVAEVSENTPANTVVVTLGEEGIQDQYFTIVGGNEDDKFAIDGNTGTIRTTGELDRERTAMYSLQVETRGRSPDQHLYWTLVQISVVDVNDNSPIFIGQQPIRFSKSIDDLDELSSNMQIGRVEVEDLDSDDNGRLELRVAPPMNRLFSISADGVVSIAGDFTAAHFGEHRLFVVARDHGEPFRETKAEVIINIYGTLITMATVPPTNEIFEYTSSIEEETPTRPDDYLQSVTSLPPSVTQTKISAFSSFPDPSPAPAPPTLLPQFPSVELPNSQEKTTDDYDQPTSEEMQSTYTENSGATNSPHSYNTLPSAPSVPTNSYSSFSQENLSVEQQVQSSSENNVETVPAETTMTLMTSSGEFEPSVTESSLASQTSSTPTTLSTTIAPRNTEILTSQETSSSNNRLAPVFNPAQISVHVEENKAEIEVARVHASYLDGQHGPISYVLQKGDPSLFAVSSFSGSIILLKPLDAETDTSYQIQVSTIQANQMMTDPSRSHYVTIVVHVDDTNDWIPAFETGNEHFTVPENTIPGQIVGQVSAFDQDRQDPNNRIHYRLISAGGLESHFNINPENGIITLARPIDAFSGEKITLKIEASDHGIPPQSSQTSVLVEVVATASQVIPEGSPFSSRPSEGSLQFSLRNYTASVSEAVRPPHLVQVLSVNNKPSDTRFIICNIVSGNYRGAFGVVAGNDGNCELRTQMELDRESVERYLLNVTVTAGTQTDFALVSVTVLDVNDNVPRFIYDNDLGLSTYFAGISSTSPAFTRVLTVKAEDADIGNSSIVNYALDQLSVQSKFFNINAFGEITLKQSMQQILQYNRLSSFEIRVSACDSPISGQQLCSKADVVVSVITDANRFKMITTGLTQHQLQAHQKDMVRSLRQFTGDCSLVNIEKMNDGAVIDTQPRTDIYWYAVNPTTKKICKKQEYKKLFETPSVQMIAGKVQPWFKLEKISDDVVESNGLTATNGIFPANWKTASILLLSLAVVIAVGSIIAIIAVCYCYTKYKVSERNVHAYNPQKTMGPFFLANGPMDHRYDTNHEVQVREMTISDEDLTLKSGSAGCTTHPRGYTYRDYNRHPSSGFEGDFSIEENMYAINTPGRLDPVTKRIQTLVIPAPDYPAQRTAINYHNKSIL
ncbi:unnamed protein product [Auanema sp. JU1783]|nr:unnamed protein product [Auanema sp. JU1783]